MKVTLWQVALGTLVVQLIVTYLFTKTQRFSIRALVRNLSITVAIYYAVVLKRYWLLLLPVALEIVIELVKLHGFDMDPYVATEYQYSDYWRDRSPRNPLISNFSEANFDGILGLNTTDNSPENNKRLYEWSKYVYLESLNKPTPQLYDLNGEIVPPPAVLKKYVDDKKFELIAKQCKVQPGMRILEIGFGDGDFLDYIYKHYGIRPVGVSISNEQVKAVRERGFTAFHMNSWDMTPEVLGTYDLILQCGNLEYIARSGQDRAAIYTKYCSIIKRLLNPRGKYFITSCHINDKFTKGTNYTDFSADYLLHGYFVWAGNDGWYPYGRDGFSQYANNVGLKTVYQQERTHDYFVNMNFLFSYFQCANGSCVTSFSIPSLLDALFKTIAGPYYIHTYLCYLSTGDYGSKDTYIWNPFLWEFAPQDRNGIWQPPVTLQYIMFEKTGD
jgi:cyclopropane fatty-acyl-phospholipid synthase-like methyltransferase